MTAIPTLDATPDKTFRFIPFRKQDLVEMCLQGAALQTHGLAGQEDDFRQLCTLLGSVYHFDFHKILERLKDSYAPLDPDADTRHYTGATEADSRTFVDMLGHLLDKANYEQVSQEDLNKALGESSLFKISLQVDFNDFSEVLLFCRGEARRRQTVASCFGLVKREIEFVNYDRVVLYLRFREGCPHDSIARRSMADDGNPASASRPGTTLLKLFQNVPKADLEMLFPNTHVRMRTIDKLLIGIPAVVSGGIVLTTKLGTSLVVLGSLLGFWLGFHQEPVVLNQAVLMALLAGAGALGGYLWKQFSSFKNRKLRFMQTLTQNLYFKNLDNNAGVFYRLTNDAEEEECKEALLAYYTLLIAPGPLSRLEIDQQIEHRMATEWGCNIDFEIDDALQKLQALALVDETDGLFSAVPIAAAIRTLDRRWDDYFVPAGA